MNETDFDLKNQFIRSINETYGSIIASDLGLIAHVDWPKFFQSLADLERFLTNEQIRSVGRNLIKLQAPLSTIVRANQSNSLMNQNIDLFGASGLLALALPIESKALQISKNQMEISIELNSEVPGCSPFFEMMTGLIEQLSMAAGYPTTTVDKRGSSHQAQYSIKIGARSILSTCKVKLTNLFSNQERDHLLQQMAAEYLQTVHTSIHAPSEAESNLQTTRQIDEGYLDGVVIVNNRLEIAEVNPSFCTITGYERQSLIGVPIRNVIPVLPGVDSESGYTNVNAFCEDKSLRPLAAFRSRQDGEGNTTYIVRDLMEETRARREQSKLSSQLRAAQKMDAIGQLSSGIVHDFNNLLFAIQASAELAIDDPSRRPIALQEIVSATRRGTGITSRLLQYSRSDQDLTKPVDLNDVIRNISGLVQVLLPETVSIELSLSTDPAPVNAAEHQIEQIIMNLLVNARDAMPSGGCCRIETTVSKGTVMLSISDEGTGIDPSIQERIFEPLFSTKTKDRGTGLGLSIIAEIIKGLGGVIDVESTLGQGARFNISLPAATARPIPALQSNKPTPAFPSAQGNTAILVVEDNEQVRTLSSLMLKAAGYQVTTASNGQEAIEQLEQKPQPDLVLLDVVLPVMGGHETSRRINRLSPDTAILFTSAYSTNSPQLNFIQQYQLPFIAKPFTRSEIEEKILQVLAEKGVQKSDAS